MSMMAMNIDLTDCYIPGGIFIAGVAAAFGTWLFHAKRKAKQKIAEALAGTEVSSNGQISLDDYLRRLPPEKLKNILARLQLRKQAKDKAKEKRKRTNKAAAQARQRNRR